MTMIGVLFLWWISTRNALSQNVVWTVGTAVPNFKNELRLDCTVDSFCCTSHNRIWETGSGTQILNNGTSSSPDKYVEEWNGSTTGFTLIIKNLNEFDTDLDYNCQYRLGNDKHRLIQGPDWEYRPGPVNNPFKQEDGSQIYKGSLDIPKLAPFPAVDASYGGVNVTSSLSSTVSLIPNTSFYRLTVSIYMDIICSDVDNRFILNVVTGTQTTTICDEDKLCNPCLKCGGEFVAYVFSVIVATKCILLPILFGLIGLCCYSCDQILSANRYQITIYGKEYRREMADKAFILALAVTYFGCMMLYAVSGAFTVGIICIICYHKLSLSVITFGLGAGVLMVIMYETIKVLKTDTKCSCERFLPYVGHMVLNFLILPIPFQMVYFCLKDEDHSALKKGLRITGLVLLTILILPIPFLIIYYCCLKSDDQCSCEKGLRITGLVLLTILILPIPFLIIYYCFLKVDDVHLWEKRLRIAGYVTLAILIFPIPFLIIYYSIKVDDQNCLKQWLRYYGLTVLTVLIFPIPFLIVYFFHLKVDKDRKMEAMDHGPHAEISELQVVEEKKVDV